MIPGGKMAFLGFLYLISVCPAPLVLGYSSSIYEKTGWQPILWPVLGFRIALRGLMQSVYTSHA
jgi:hypothetical protein